MNQYRLSGSNRTLSPLYTTSASKNSSYFFFSHGRLNLSDCLFKPTQIQEKEKKGRPGKDTSFFLSVVLCFLGLSILLLDYIKKIAMGKNAGAGGGGGGVVEGENNDLTKEGQNLLGPPTFKELENGRFKCVETGHELPAHARDSYSQSKHCRLGLIDAALAHNKPPLNMFHQDPQSRSKLICKLTGVTINKTEEHIWKHINGKRFLNMLERMETENSMPNRMMEEQDDQKERKKTKTKDGSKEKKKKQDKPVSEVISEVRDVSEKDGSSEVEDDFWMPPVGECWDNDDGGHRWGSCSEPGAESDDTEIEANAETEEVKQEAGKLSRRTKRMSLEVGPSSFASRKKKKKKTESS